MLIVPPDKEYLHYIDFRVLALLFCLMAVVAAFKSIGVFSVLTSKLLSKVKNARILSLCLIALPFFSSMLVTNDVALIVFVPFTAALLIELGFEKNIVPVLVFQTVAANLGSMATPVGNPQNLYLYGKTTMNFASFMFFMLPYTVIAFTLLAVWCLLFRYKGEKKIELKIEQNTGVAQYKKQLVVYSVLFVLCILTVAHVISYMATLGIVLFVVFILDKRVLKEVDYALLLTFVGFFILFGVGLILQFVGSTAGADYFGCVRDVLNAK